MSDFDFRLAVSLVSSEQEFPVDFDALWQWRSPHSLARIELN